jgi:two-component system sensor histidine kinase UhpB
MNKTRIRPPPGSAPPVPAGGSAGPSATAPPPSSDNPLTLKHELHVHQIELESQNEELRRAQLELATAHDRFVDLYEFAPVGYFTLDVEGRISEANLTGSALFGSQRKALLGRRFERFVAAADSERWRIYLDKALHLGVNGHIELMMRPAAGQLQHAQLDCLRVTDGAGAVALRLTLIDVTQRKRAEMDRRIAATVVEASEAERRRVARELHEDLGQSLSALKMDLASLPTGLGLPADRIKGMLAALDDAVATVRRISTALRPLMLDDLGLNAAIDWLVHDSAQRLGLAITLDQDEGDPPLGERNAIALYRMVQETLLHIARHAHASDVAIEMRQRSGELVLTVQDNGTGWPVAASRQGDTDAAMSLREQAHLLGGRLEFGKLRGGGQRFTLYLPLPEAMAESAAVSNDLWSKP